MTPRFRNLLAFRISLSVRAVTLHKQKNWLKSLWRYNREVSIQMVRPTVQKCKQNLFATTKRSYEKIPPKAIKVSVRLLRFASFNCHFPLELIVLLVCSQGSNYFHLVSDDRLLLRRHFSVWLEVPLVKAISGRTVCFWKPIISRFNLFPMINNSN